MIDYTRREELWNTWSHAAGVLMGVAAGVIFIIMCFSRGDDWARTGVVLYLTGMLLSYITSTAYHAVPARYARTKEILRRFDHAAIYWHIAGCYSPLTLIALREDGFWGWGLFAFVWTCTLLGTAMSFARLKEHSNLETTCFCLMGLSVLVAFKPLMDCVSAAAVSWIIAEGACYLTGAVFYSINRQRYMHTVFHFFVLAGSLCHIIAVWDLLLNNL